MKRIFFIVIAVLILGGLIAWRLNAKKQATAAQFKAAAARKTAAPMVTVAPAVVRDITTQFEGIGNVQAPFNVKIASRVTGLVDYLQLREGDHVTGGEVVARIDPSQLQAQVSQQQANLAQAQFRLSQAVLTTNPTYTQVATQIRTMAAGLNSAQANYNQTSQNYNAQVAAAQAAVTDAQGKVNSAEASVANANAGINSAQSNLNNAQALYDRTYSLYKQGFVAAQDLDNAKTQLDVQKSNLDVANGQLNAAKAALSSAQAEKDAAQKQLDITRVKGKADIKSAQAAVHQAHAALTYARSNTAQKPAYQANLAALRAAVNAAQAQLKDAQAQLAYTVLRSSISGYVTARYADPGTVVTAGQPVLAIQAIRDIYVVTSVPDTYSDVMHVGMSAACSFDALPGRAFVGKVTQVNPAADPQSRQFTIFVTLDNRQNLIKPGMFARVDIVTKRSRNQTVVPREAVKQGKNGSTVTVVDAQNVAHVHSVKTGAQDTQGIAITQGLKAGENVITLSNVPIKDGQKVRLGTVGQTAAEGAGGTNAAGTSTGSIFSGAPGGGTTGTTGGAAATGSGGR